MSIYSTHFWEEVPVSDAFPMKSNENVALKIVSETLKIIEVGKGFFDPLVGENSCQIRVWMYAELATQPETKQRACECLAKAKDLSFKIPKIFAAAVWGYILTTTKKSKGSFSRKGAKIEFDSVEKTDPELLGEKIGISISNKYAKQLDSYARVKLSEFSVEYVQKLAHRLPDTAQNQILRKYIASEFLHIEKKTQRVALPCFFFMDFLFKGALWMKIPILIRAHRVDPEKLCVNGGFLILYKSDGEHYLPHPIEKEDPWLPLIVMNGYSMSLVPFEMRQIEEALLTIPLEVSVLATDAAHRQYPGDLNDEKRPEESRCAYFKRLAQTLGLCKENPSLWFSDHVFADSLGRQLGEIQNRVLPRGVIWKDS